MQPSQNNRDKPVDRGRGWEAAGCCEGVETVARKLVGGDIVPDLASPGRFCQQFPDHVAEFLVRLGDPLVLMKKRGDVGAVVLVVMVLAALSVNVCVGFEHRFEPLTSVTSLVPDVGEILEMASDLTVVPGQQDRLDIREVLVQRRASDPGLRGDPRHRYREQPVLGHQRRRRVQDRVAHLATVRLDCRVPQLRHAFSIRDGVLDTI